MKLKRRLGKDRDEIIRRAKEDGYRSDSSEENFSQKEKPMIFSTSSPKKVKKYAILDGFLNTPRGVIEMESLSIPQKTAIIKCLIDDAGEWYPNDFSDSQMTKLGELFITDAGELIEGVPSDAQLAEVRALFETRKSWCVII